MRIYKYPLALQPIQEIHVPLPFKPLAVQMQRDQITLWGETSGGEPVRTAEVLIAGTGHEVPNEARAFKQYVGTVQTPDHFVWHVYCEDLR